MSLRRRLALFVGLAAVAATGGAVTFAAYTATTGNSNNRAITGTVKLSDSDGGSSAMFALTGLLPGDSQSACMRVTYEGSLASTVRLYGTTSGSGLDSYLNLKVTRGTYPAMEPAFDSCTGFNDDATNYIGQGSGVVYSGTLAGFPDSYATGLVDPIPGTPESWALNEKHVYRFQVTQQNDSAAENKTATQEFTWEAQNQ
jgi:hypothetical protein